MDWIRQVVAGELQVLALVAGPATAALCAWLVALVRAHVRSAAVQSEVSRLVAWAQQAIPDKSDRYAQVAGLLSARFPALKGTDLEVLIESEVHALKTGLAPLAAPVSVAATSPPAVADRPAPSMDESVSPAISTGSGAAAQPSALAAAAAPSVTGGQG